VLEMQRFPDKFIGGRIVLPFRFRHSLSGPPSSALRFHTPSYYLLFLTRHVKSQTMIWPEHIHLASTVSTWLVDRLRFESACANNLPC
jgi:hypothetical protein